MILIGLFAVLIVGVGFLLFKGNFQQSALPSGDGGTSTANCAIAPTISLSVTDSQDASSSIETVPYYKVDGNPATTSSSGLVFGDSVQILITNSTGIDKILPAVTLKCGANPVYATMDMYSAPTLTLKDPDNADATLTDSASGGAVNLTGVSAGSSIDVTVQVKGTDKKTTGDLIYVVELGSTQNVSGITLYDNNGFATEVSVPKFYAQSVAGSYVTAFRIPAIVGSQTKTYTMTISAVTGDTIVGAMYTTAYVEQSFVDSDGTYKTGIENSLKATKYEATFDYDAYLA